MAHTLIEKTCVRIIVKENNEVKSLGTGVIVSYENKYYVLTASHCLGNPLPELENLYIEKQSNYTSSFENITVYSICSHNFSEDWALLEIEYHDNEKVLESCKIGKNFIQGEPIKFCGYQNITKHQYRPYDGKILLLSDSKFQIKLIEDTFQQAGEDGQYVAQGLSGSGVYIIKHNTPYLIGILNSVKSKKAWNDDIDCSSLKCFSDIISELEDLSDIDYLKKWNKKLETDNIPEQIRKYQNTNNNDFRNLQRKNRVMYDTIEDADRITNEQLLKYLTLKENISEIADNQPNIYVEFQNIVNKFQDTVKNEYSRSVTDNNEAKDKKIQLKNDLKDELEDLFPKEIKFDVADYQIIEWLLDCSLNFTNR